MADPIKQMMFSERSGYPITSLDGECLGKDELTVSRIVRIVTLFGIRDVVVERIDGDKAFARSGDLGAQLFVEDGEWCCNSTMNMRSVQRIELYDGK